MGICMWVGPSLRSNPMWVTVTGKALRLTAVNKMQGAPLSVMPWLASRRIRTRSLLTARHVLMMPSTAPTKAMASVTA